MSIPTPLSYWKLDESSGDAVDLINSLIAVNTSVTYSAGKINNGAVYNGSAYHTISDNTAIKPASDISISLWVYISSTSSYQMLLAKGENAGDTRSYEMRCFGTTTQIDIQCRTGGGSYMVARTTTAIGTGAWTHIVYTRTGATQRIYINGVSDTLAVNTTQTTSIDYSTDALWFGQRNGAYRFNGKLDEIGIWNVALTTDEVNKLYNASRGNQYPFTDNLATAIESYYTFDGSASTDIVAGLFNGTDTTITYAGGNAKIGANGAGFGGSSKIAVTRSTGLSGSYTISAWIKFTATGVTQCIHNSHVTSYNNYWSYFYINGSQKLAFDMYDGTNNPNMVSTATLSTNTWYHVVAVRDVVADQLRIYINGASGATAITDSTTSTPVYSASAMGQRTASTDGLTGAIDDVGIWSRALTTTEITYLFASGAPTSLQQYPFTSSFIPRANPRALQAIRRASSF